MQNIISRFQNDLSRFQWWFTHVNWFMVLEVVSGVLAVLFLYVWATYNAIIKKRNQVKTDFSDIDVQLKRKGSLIQNLVELVKEYAKHEKETFQGVAQARSALDTSKSTHDTAKAENMLTQTLRSLFMVVEQYPKLVASENYKQLRDDLNETENLIASYREEYNRSVQDFNNFIQTFPNLLVATSFGFHEEELFVTTQA